MRVLLADDDPVSRRLVEMRLQVLGYDVVSCSDGNQAWRILDSGNAPRLAVMDWMMPGLSGVEICQKVRVSRPHPYVYIVLLTSRVDKADVITGLEAGADDYLAKPFFPGELEARIRAGARIVALHDRLLRTQQKLQEQAIRDELTGLWNRRMILDFLDRELARNDRGGRPSSVIFVDIDHFKSVNDLHGHLVGDSVLVQVAARIGRCLRRQDGIGRYGGEEFLIVPSECGAEAARVAAERIRRCCSEEPVLVDSLEIGVTVSCGVATFEASARPGGRDLLDAADQALYRAKRAGRDRVEVLEVSEVSPIPQLRAPSMPEVRTGCQKPGGSITADAPARLVTLPVAPVH